MSALADAVPDYLAVRRALGFKLSAAGQLLPGFVAWCEQAGIEWLTPEAAVAWAREPVGAGPVWWGKRMEVVRGFARYLHAQDPRHAVPPADLLPAPACRATPYLYSAADIAALLAAAQALPHPLRAATYATLVGLLAATGMRIGEAIRLDRADVDFSEGALTVRASKFGKSRELILHPSTVEALRAYAGVRDQAAPRASSEPFFVSTRGTRLVYNEVQRTFRALTRDAGLGPRSPRCRPRLHDLRHTFATDTLLGWYRAGLDVEARIHALSTYLGHRNPANTYWYLSAAPELLALVCERLERSRPGEP
jgi:integrase/recombinase XerD